MRSGVVSIFFAIDLQVAHQVAVRPLLCFLVLQCIFGLGDVRRSDDRLVEADAIYNVFVFFLGVVLGAIDCSAIEGIADVQQRI